MSQVCISTFSQIICPVSSPWIPPTIVSLRDTVPLITRKKVMEICKTTIWLFKSVRQGKLEMAKMVGKINCTEDIEVDGFGTIHTALFLWWHINKNKIGRSTSAENKQLSLVHIPWNEHEFGNKEKKTARGRGIPIPCVVLILKKRQFW